MPADKKPRTLIEMLPPGAPASPELEAWSRAFERWLEEEGPRRGRKWKNGVTAEWRHLLEHCPKMPWTVTPADIQAYAGHLAEHGRGRGSIKLRLYRIAGFYRWLRANGMVGENTADPVADVDLRQYYNPNTGFYLSRTEADALLRVIGSQPWLLSKRDFAYVQARLLVGITDRDLNRLQWGQIEHGLGQAQAGEGGGQVYWIERGEGKPRVELPRKAWEAIEDYLRASGRLSEHRTPEAEAFIFAGLIPAAVGETGDPDEWNERRPVGYALQKGWLGRYGRAAGIAPEKLGAGTLRHTAVAWFLEENGGSIRRLQQFLGVSSWVAAKSYKQYMKRMMARIGEGPAAPGLKTGAAQDRAALPGRQRHHFSVEGEMRHGFFASRQPEDELRQVLAEGVQGMQAEIDGLVALCDRLLARHDQMKRRRERRLLSEAYAESAGRLADMYLSEGWMKNDLLFDLELEDFSDHSGELQALEGVFEVEIATVRVILRRTYRLAMGDMAVKDLVYLVKLYGWGCKRLMRLLKRSGQDPTPGLYRGGRWL